MSFKMSSGLSGSSCDRLCIDTKDALHLQNSQFWSLPYDTWYFYFSATTALHSILDPETDNCKFLLKSYFNWLHQRCHVNQKNKNWKDASLIQNSKPFRHWRWVKRNEEIRRKWGAKEARFFTMYEIIHKNTAQNMNKVDTGEDMTPLMYARVLWSRKVSWRLWYSVCTSLALK